MVRVCILMLSSLFAYTAYGQDIIDQQLNLVKSEMQSSGYNRVGQPQTFYLNDDSEKTITLQLEANTGYRIWGVCDGDCEDLDLELLDVYGNQIDIDNEPDDVPVLDPFNLAAGPYTLKVSMYECSVAPCKVGIDVYSGANSGGTTGSGSTSGNYDDTLTPRQVVDNELQDIEEDVISAGYSPFRDTEYFTLGSGEEKVIPIRLSHLYNYQIWGACDGDCQDLDMELVDAKGVQIDVDELADSRPLIDPENIASGNYLLKVSMYNCTVEPCAVGVNFYSR